MPKLNIERLLAKAREVHAPGGGRPAHEAGSVAPTSPQQERPWTPLALFRELSTLGIRLVPSPDETLRLDPIQPVLPAALHTALEAQRDALLLLVEWYEERAGIAQYEGGLARAEAEQEAWRWLQEQEDGPGMATPR